MKARLSGYRGDERLQKESSIYSQNEKDETQKRYVFMKPAESRTNNDEKPIVKSKVLVIDKLIVTVKDTLEKGYSFDVDTVLAPVNGIVPKMDICAKEDIIFTSDMKLSDIESIIRRCGILEQYSEYFTKDPEIVINSYSIHLEREFEYFAEFHEAMLAARDVFS